MTLLYATGWEPYSPMGDRTALDDEWDFHGAASSNETGFQPEDVTITSGRFFGGQAVDIHCRRRIADTTRQAGMQLPLAGLSSASTWVVGFAFNPLAFPDETLPVIWWEDSEDTPLLTLCVETDGSLTLRRGGNLATEIDSHATSIGNDWMYLEMKVTFHGSTGSYEVRRAPSTRTPSSSVTLMSGSGMNTTGTGGVRPYQLGLASDGDTNNNPHWQFDDFYLLDGVDATVTQGRAFDDFQGDISVFRVRPNAVGDVSQFTTSAAADNYTLVDEDSQDSDTTYVESKTAGQQDLYHYEDLDSQEVGTILAVIARPVLRKTEAGSRQYKLLAKSSGTVEKSAARQVSETYVRQDYLWPTDPATGASWTFGAFNAAQFGQEVSA